MVTTANLMRTARLTHTYLGVFVAPAILFFAFTGILQTFSLHSTSKTGSYRPARWIVTLAQLHKKQTIQLPPSKVQGSEGNSSKPRPKEKATVSSSPAESEPTRNPLPMKLFFALVGCGLFVSTFTGLYLSFMYSRNKVVLSCILAAGVVTPIVLAAI